MDTNLGRRRRERIELWRLRRPRSVPVSRVFCHAERSLWAAKPHEGASEQAVGTCCLISAVASRKAPSSPNDCRSPMWNMGAVKRICGSKSKTPYQRPSGQLIDRYTVDEWLKTNTLKHVCWQHQLLEKNFPAPFARKKFCKFIRLHLSALLFRCKKLTVYLSVSPWIWQILRQCICRFRSDPGSFMNTAGLKVYFFMPVTCFWRKHSACARHKRNIFRKWALRHRYCARKRMLLPLWLAGWILRFARL